jgi:hypothetical protein
VSHLVERLELDIQAADEDQARQLLDRLSRLHRQALEGVIERVLDQLSPTDTVHRLEKLDLDLGEIPAEQLERLLPQRLESALRRALPSRLRSARVRGQGRPVRAGRHGPGAARDRGSRGASIPASPVPVPSSAASQPVNVQEAPDPLAGPPPSAAPPPVAVVAGDTAGSGFGSPLLELLAFYGAGGTLPWWAPRDNPRLIPATIEAALLLPPAELTPFLRQLASTPAAQRRLLAALDPDQRPALRLALARLAPESSSQDADPPAPQPSDAPTAQRQPVSQEPPQQSLPPPLSLPPQPPQPQRSPDPAAIPPIRQRTLDAPAPQSSDAPAAQRRPASQEPPQQSLPLSLPPQPPQPQRIPDPAAIPPIRQRSLDSPALQPSEAASAQPQLARQEPPQSSLRQQIQNPATNSLPRERSGEAIQVDGAGLALLWPFLDTLLDRLDWLTPERHRIRPAQQQRALALLGYLVNGDPRPPEWRLPLAKLLCGLPLNAVFTLEEDLSAAELAEADRLLEAVLAHGDGLLGENVHSLRTTWLQRPGLLNRRPQAWLLVVERRAATDGALERLPWGVSWLRLPWMGELVQVGW